MIDLISAMILVGLSSSGRVIDGWLEMHLFDQILIGRKIAGVPFARD